MPIDELEDISAGATLLGGGMLLVFIGFVLILKFLVLAGFWKAYSKAGQPS